MLGRFIFLVVFLLTLIKPVYAETVDLNLYGAYDFTTKSFSVFWKNPSITYTSYVVELYKLTLSQTCGDNTLTLLKTANTSGNNLTFTTLAPDYYKIKIKGINNTTQTEVFVQDFFIAVSSPSFSIGWCNTDSVNLTDTVVFVETVPTFTFSNSVSVPEYKNMTLSKETSYFQVLNMIFVNKFGTQTSPPSGQVIVYSAIPKKPTWKGISKLN